MRPPVCVDSSVLIKLVVDEPDSHQAVDLWRQSLVEDRLPVAPALLPFEVTAILRKCVHQGRLSRELAAEALDLASALGLEILTFDGLHRQALQLAQRFSRPTAYDAHYLALAQELGCPFWTADRKLYESVSAELPWVHLLSQLRAGPNDAAGDS